MSAEEPKTAPVSVVIPCFRCSKTIERAVSSVARQVVLPLEIVLVEDHSGDGTLAALEHLAEKYPQCRIKIVALPENVGAGGARNAGWNASSGEYVAFLDADDAWHHQKIQIQYEWMRNNPEVMLTGHRSVPKKRDDPILAPTNKITARLVSRSGLLLSNAFSTRTAMLHRGLPVHFDPSRRYMEDHWWLLQIAFSKFEIYKIELPLAYTFKADYGEGGLSGSLWEMEKGELANYRELQENGAIARPLALILAAYSLSKYFRRAVISLAKKLCYSENGK